MGSRPRPPARGRAPALRYTPPGGRPRHKWDRPRRSPPGGGTVARPPPWYGLARLRNGPAAS
eukprot:1937593-Lingulodinium_polyedra.AAC.1